MGDRWEVRMALMKTEKKKKKKKEEINGIILTVCEDRQKK